MSTLYSVMIYNSVIMSHLKRLKKEKEEEERMKEEEEEEESFFRPYS